MSGVSDFRRVFGEPTTLERDLLRLAGAVFAADRATTRGEREDITRHFALRLPAVNAARLDSCVPLIERVLRTLSNDSWTITIEDMEGPPEGDYPRAGEPGATLLFSGGLDSLAAGLEFGRRDRPLQLVSHVTKNKAIDIAQHALAERIASTGRSVQHRQFFVSSRSGGRWGLEHDAESSQRTRSFLFLVLAALVARRTRCPDIVYMAENGQMAIHLPLVTSRVGAFSTHTAHPDVLADMEALLQTALRTELHITNPYVHRTKAEVVAVITREMPDAIQISNSCWRSGRLPTGVSHCGACVPCLERRIAVRRLMPDDPTAYARDVFSEDLSSLPEDDDGRRNLYDLVEFVARIRAESPEEIMSEWPELYSEHVDARAVIDMYKRFAEEAAEVFQGSRVAQGLLA